MALARLTHNAVATAATAGAKIFILPPAKWSRRSYSYRVPTANIARSAGHVLDAAANLRYRIAALNKQRQAAELPVTDTHVALHVGELLAVIRLLTGIAIVQADRLEPDR